MSDKLEPCFICKSKNCTVLHDVLEFYKKYDCKRCGNYTITEDAIEDISQNIPSVLSGWLRERNLYGIEIPLLTSSFVNELIKTLPRYSASEKQNKLLKAIEKLTNYPGKVVELSLEFDISLAWAENKDEFKYYVRSLIDRNLLKESNTKTFSQPTLEVFITAKGQEYLEKDRTNIVSRTQAFVAMSFDKELRPIYENAIKLAIIETGYTPCLVDMPHLDRIDAKIIADIRNS